MMCSARERKEWNLVIAGWGEDLQIKELRDRIKLSNLHESIHFIGPQYGDKKTSCFDSADAFILPSFSEGSPMAVLEAWSYQLPVLMTEHCNLHEGFSSNSAIKIDPRVDSIRAGLMKLFSLTDKERSEYGINGKRLVESSYSWPKLAKQMSEVYEWMLGKGKRPNCVIEN